MSDEVFEAKLLFAGFAIGSVDGRVALEMSSSSESDNIRSIFRLLPTEALIAFAFWLDEVRAQFAKSDLKLFSFILLQIYVPLSSKVN